MMEPTRPSASRNWKPFTVFGLLLILLILLLQPSLYAVTMVNYALITVSLAVSLQLIFGFAGQVSLAHAAFFGIGAYVSAILSVRYGWPFLLALPAAGLAASLVSLLLAPLGRLREHYFAMATLAFGLITYRFFASWQEITGGWLGIGNIPKPSFFGLLPIGSARAFLVLLAAALAVQYVFMNRLTSGRLGRNFRSIRDDEVAAASLGIPVGRSKMQAVILGCFWAGLAGSLMAHLNGFISPEPFSFWYSVLLALMVVVGGLGSFPGAALGSMGLTLVNEGLKETVLLRPILYGALIVILMIYLPEGLAGGYQRLLGRRGRGRGGKAGAKEAGAEGAAGPAGEILAGAGALVDSALGYSGAPGGSGAEELERFLARPEQKAGETLMRIEGMVKRFGGLTAVDQVDLAIPAGRLCGLIGANGAGKTTLFNLITGIEAPTNGKVFFRDRELTGLKMEDRAAAGIIRTFQRTRLFLSMTVLENVMAGMALHFRNGALDALVRPRRVRNDEAEARRLAVALVHLVGLAGREFEPCRNLPYGHRRLVELARALAARPAVLLLDEPAAGLNHEERQHLQGLIRRLRDEFGLTIVLVEHHLSLVLQTCDRVVVLHHGRKIAEDVPGRIVQNDQVIEAYLGTRRRVLDA